MQHLLYDLMIKYIGIPYIWGGNHPLEGFDCSGLVLWLMKSVNWWGKEDTTAQGLYDELMEMGHCDFDLDDESYLIGTIAFFGKSESRVTHVGMIVADRLMIEAGGGGRKNRTYQDSVANGGQVRIRSIDDRQDLVALVSPLAPGLRTSSDPQAF